jgi:hypothetical protein
MTDEGWTVKQLLERLSMIEDTSLPVHICVFGQSVKLRSVYADEFLPNEWRVILR